MSATGVLQVAVHGRVGEHAIDVALSTANGPAVIVGPNGAGKTSALMMILGAVRPRRGRITLGPLVLFDDQLGVDVPLERRRIGFLPQRTSLFPHLDVLGNVAYGIHGQPRAARLANARQTLQQLGIEPLASRRPSELSGGEAQRVALARALGGHPRALLLDEPLAALDAGVRRETRRFLAAHLRTLEIPTVVVTHHHADALAFGGEVTVLERGAVVQQGRLEDIAGRPASPFVQQFVTRPTEP